MVSCPVQLPVVDAVSIPYGGRMSAVWMTSGHQLALAPDYCCTVGAKSERMEACMIGEPMSHISVALNQAASGQIVAAPSAWKLADGTLWESRELSEGCMLISGKTAKGVQELPNLDSLIELHISNSQDACCDPDDLRYIPLPVVNKCGHGTMAHLAEHRLVTILFLVQKVGWHGRSALNIRSLVLQDRRINALHVVRRSQWTDFSLCRLGTWTCPCQWRH